MDRVAFHIPAAGQGAQSCLPRQVRRRTAASLCPDQLRFFGECVPLLNQKRFAVFLRTLYRQDWVIYAGALYASRRHLQPSSAVGLSR